MQLSSVTGNISNSAQTEPEDHTICEIFLPACLRCCHFNSTYPAQAPALTISSPPPLYPLTHTHPTLHISSKGTPLRYSPFLHLFYLVRHQVSLAMHLALPFPWRDSEHATPQYAALALIILKGRHLRNRRLKKGSLPSFLPKSRT